MQTRLLRKIDKKLKIKDLDIDIQIDQDHIAHLDGAVNTWEDVVDIGHLVGKNRKIKNVVNNLYPKGMPLQKRDKSDLINQGNRIGVIHEADVVIVGGGVIGCGIARELSQYDLTICLVEK